MIWVLLLQIPIFETRSDGRDNLLGALIMAGHYCIPEVRKYAQKSTRHVRVFAAVFTEKCTEGVTTDKSSTY